MDLYGRFWCNACSSCWNVTICTKSTIKKFRRLSIAPGIFNINEMVTFGMPIVMNPLLLIPFILVPVVLTIVSYFAMEWGWVARPSVAVPWTTPILFSGYLGSRGKFQVLFYNLLTLR